MEWIPVRRRSHGHPRSVRHQSRPTDLEEAREVRARAVSSMGREPVQFCPTGRRRSPRWPSLPWRMDRHRAHEAGNGFPRAADALRGPGARPEDRLVAAACYATKPVPDPQCQGEMKWRTGGDRDRPQLRAMSSPRVPPSANGRVCETSDKNILISGADFAPPTLAVCGAASNRPVVDRALPGLATRRPVTRRRAEWCSASDAFLCGAGLALIL